MKKFIKWFIFWLVVLGGVALAVCYMVIPTETKSAVDIVIGYLNTPLGIAGGTTITVGMAVYLIASHLLKLNREKAVEDFNECVRELEKQKKLIEIKYKEEKENAEKKIEQVEDKANELNEKYLHLVDVHNNTLNDILSIIELIPNKKVQEKVEELYGRQERIDN